MFHSRNSDLDDLIGNDAYRAFLISRNAPPIVHHSGGMHWKRLRVAARHGVSHIKGFFAALRVALVADKMRRAERALAVHGGHHDRAHDRSGR